jgi:hypothetical protein
VAVHSIRAARWPKRVATPSCHCCGNWLLATASRAIWPAGITDSKAAFSHGLTAAETEELSFSHPSGKQDQSRVPKQASRGRTKNAGCAHGKTEEGRVESS